MGHVGLVELASADFEIVAWGRHFALRTICRPKGHFEKHK
jgi:hypothetical protein